jgi:hypothetical protein
MGCFFEREPVAVDPLRIEAWWPGLPPCPYYMVDNNMWSREVDGAPLNRRGWVFQERFLTVRNLSFGAKRLFWEFNCLRACETFPHGLPSAIKSNDFKVSNEEELKTWYWPAKTKGPDDPDPDSFRLWFFLVTGAHYVPHRGGYLLGNLFTTSLLSLTNKIRLSGRGGNTQRI